MKKVYLLFGMIALLVILSSSMYSPKTNTSATEMLPPTTDTLFLDLPNEPFDYNVQFPVHILETLGIWGTDTSTVASITDEGATLGRALFYDVRLSGDNSLSCGSCHKQSLSFADDVALSDGINGQLTTRNSMQLNDLGWQAPFGFFWDMRSFSLQEGVLEPILAAHELGKEMPTLINKLEATEDYPVLFEEAFGSSEINSERIGLALAQFIASMTTFNTKLDQYLAGLNPGLTASELNGMELFQQNCEMCHFAPHFGAGTGGGFFFVIGNNGLDSVFTDLGAFEIWGSGFEGVFKSPSLRNIALTAPYMHDGRFASLEEVIDFYSDEVLHNPTSGFNWIFGEDFDGYHFTEDQKADIIAFMNMLTDEDFLQNEKWSNPWTSVVSISPPPLLEGVKVYPNPVADFIQIELNKPAESIYLIQLFDIKGQLIKSIETSEMNYTLNRNQLPAGIYNLKVSNGEKITTKKLIFN